MEDNSEATPFGDKLSGSDTKDTHPKIKRETSHNDSLLEELSSTPSVSNITDFCDEDQTALTDDPKKNIKQGVPSICNHFERFNDLDTKITKCLEQNIQTHLKLDYFQNSLTVLLQQIGCEAGALLSVEASDEDDDANKISSPPSSKLDEIDDKIAQCMSSNKQTHLKLDNLQRALDTVLKYFENNSEKLVSHEKQSDTFNFPLSTLNEVNKLDKELSINPNLMSELVTKFSKVAGDTGNKSAKTVGIKIIDRIISPKLLTHFSWSGRKFGSNQKLPFRNYRYIFKLCHQLISKADRSFSSVKCEIFLRNLLKHSSQRLARKFNATQSKRSKLADRVSLEEESECFSQNEQSILPEQEYFFEELSNAEEVMVDSKENIMNCLLDQIESKNETNDTSLSPNPVLKICSHEDKLDEMDKKMSACIESNVQVHTKLDHMQQTFQLILNSIGIGRVVDSVPDHCPRRSRDVIPIVQHDVLDSFQFPLTKVSDLKNLNRKLSANENFENILTNKIMSFIGNPKRKSLQRFGLEVVEYVISLQLLMKYTWTGRTNGSRPKLALMKYRSVVSFFQRVISKADESFNRKECEIFLKNTVLKYINLRIARRGGKHYSDEDYNQDFKKIRPSFEETSLDLDDACKSKYEMDSLLDGEGGNNNLDLESDAL